MRHRGIALMWAGALGVALWAGDGIGQVAKGKTRPAPTKFLMQGISKANCSGLDTVLKDAGPADDKAWETAACHAACLSELSFVLMDDGRCPDAVWAGAAKKLREGAAAAAAGAEKKDLAAARAGLETVKGSCKACHDAHRLKK